MEESIAGMDVQKTKREFAGTTRGLSSTSHYESDAGPLAFERSVSLRFGEMVEET